MKLWDILTLVLTLRISVTYGSRSAPAGRIRSQLTNDLEGENTSSSNRRVPSRVDPHHSWISFVQHSDRAARRLTKGGKVRPGKSKKKDQLPATHCPPGPPGPVGPRGAPGAVVTEEVLMKEFRELVKEEVARRTQQPEVCSGCSKMPNATWRMVDVDEVSVIPRVAAGFHHRLKSNVVVQGRTFIEVKNFHRPFGGGAFQRGNVFSAAEGRFTAPRDGIYQLTANMHVAHDTSNRKHGRKLRKRDNIRVLICIMSLCQKHTSLEFISGLESNSRKFTVTITGLLHLEAGHYVSIYTENGSRTPVTILEGSDFSGILLGV